MNGNIFSELSLRDLHEKMNLAGYNLVPRVSHLGGKMRDPGNEIGRARKEDERKNRYAMRTCVCYLEIQRPRRKEGNARLTNEGHLRFVSVAFAFHRGRWNAKYVRGLFSFS